MPGAIAWVGRAPRPSAWSRAVRALSVSLLSRHPLPAKLTTDPLVIPHPCGGAAGPSRMDVVVAFGADDQGRATHGDHTLLPDWKLAPALGMPWPSGGS